MDWINTKDKKPKNYESVFVWYEGRADYMYYHKTKGFFKNNMDDYSLNENEFILFPEVTQWIRIVPPTTSK